jgi:integrase
MEPRLPDMATRATTSKPGTMRERSPGHWELRAFVGRDPVTGKPRQATRTFTGGERAASKELARLVGDVEKGKFKRTTVTVGQMLDKWLEDAEVMEKQRPRTLYENKKKVEHRIRPALGHVRLDKLRPDVLDEQYLRWLAEGLSASTVNKYHSILSAACRRAVKWEWIDKAPTDNAEPPQPTRKAMLVPTPEQLTKLIKSAEKSDPVLASGIGLAALTGARRGELVALRWSDVDLKAGRMTISKSLTVADGEQHEGETKTHQARTLALDPIAVELFKRRWSYMVDLSAEVDSPLVDDPYVLSYNGNGALAVNPDTLTHKFGALCEAMELPALKRLRKTNPKAERTDLTPKQRWPFRFHDLRHFSVTTLIAAGVDIRTVAERHGHARATMTLDRYAHALPERDREAAALLGATLKI